MVDETDTGNEKNMSRIDKQCILNEIPKESPSRRMSKSHQQSSNTIDDSGDSTAQVSTKKKSVSSKPMKQKEDSADQKTKKKGKKRK